MSQISSTYIILIYFILTSIIPFVSSELKLVFEISHHGLREKIYNILKTKMQYFPGELTEAGMRQHYVLGQKLRDYYYYNLSFIPESYSNDQIFIRSTNLNRTIQSALSQLLGLYPLGTGPTLSWNQQKLAKPPLYDLNISNSVYELLNDSALPYRYQTKSIVTTNLSTDTLLHGYDQVVCPNIKFYINQTLNNRTDPYANQMKNLFNRVMNDIKDIIHRDLSGPINSISELQWLYYEILNDNYNNITNPIDINSPLFHDIELLQHFYVYYLLLGKENQLKIINTMIFLEIQNYINIVLDDKDTYKFIYYSANDITLASILRAFDLISWECIYNQYKLNKQFDNSGNTSCISLPPYASNILIELHEINDDKYYIKFLYNGIVKLFCPSKYSLNNTYCKLEYFMDILSKYMENDIDDYNKLCGGFNTTDLINTILLERRLLQEQDYSLFNMIKQIISSTKVIIAMIIDAILCLILGYYCFKYNKTKKSQTNNNNQGGMDQSDGIEKNRILELVDVH